MAHRNVVRYVATASVILVVGGLAAVLWSRKMYHQWPWDSVPNPLTWCGRDWVPQGAQTHADIDRQYNDFRRAGDLPGWLNIGSVWTARVKGGSGFTACNITDVWVQIGSDRFEEMSLSGGP